MLVNEFQVLLERYEQDPDICGKLLRAHSLSDPKEFLSYACSALVERTLSSSTKCIAALALGAGLVEHLLELGRESRQHALTLAQSVLACEPRFDIQLLDSLRQLAHAEDQANFEICLDIVSEITRDDVLLPGVVKLYRHASPNIRSKIGFFLGSRTENLDFAARLVGEFEGRTRANIIESFYGSKSEFAYQMFRSNTADDNCRIAGNAVLGLYLLGDVSSVSLIHDFVKHPEARFRNMSIWLICRTQNPRFSPALSELMRDPEGLIRRKAFTGLGEMKKAVLEMKRRPPLKTTILDVNHDDGLSLVATVQDSAGLPVRQIAPTNFVLKTGSPVETVRAYKVEECEGSDSKEPASHHYRISLEKGSQRVELTVFSENGKGSAVWDPEGQATIADSAEALSLTA